MKQKYNKKRRKRRKASAFHPHFIRHYSALWHLTNGIESGQRQGKCYKKDFEKFRLCFRSCGYQSHTSVAPPPPSRPPARLPSHHPIKSSTRNGKISWRISTSIQSSIPAGSPIQRVLGTESWKLLQRCPADPGRIQHPESATSDSGGGNRFHRPITAPRLDCINQSQQQYSN